ISSVVVSISLIVFASNLLRQHPPIESADAMPVPDGTSYLLTISLVLNYRIVNRLAVIAIGLVAMIHLSRTLHAALALSMMVWKQTNEQCKSLGCCCHSGISGQPAYLSRSERRPSMDIQDFQAYQQASRKT